MPNTVKTFKIGLSATDKQNMAQDIYEQVEALLFSEYDSSETYNTGDYVVYSGQLYRCKEDNVTGAWNSAKWELATLQDLVDDVNGAVASVDNKANVDGNYPTLTAGLADNLTPYSEDSGTEQDEPFISQGTGTANNTEIVTVGDYSLLKEKQGNTIVVNQIFDQTPISTGAGGGSFYKWAQVVVGHKYLIYSQTDVAQYVQIWESEENTNAWGIAVNNVSQGQFSEGSSQYKIITIQSYTYLQLRSNINGSVANKTWQPFSVDLTQMFNGNIPQDLLDNPSHFSWYYNGDLSYNTGTLVNANGNKLVSTGRQLWDEEWELGSINSSTGENLVSSSVIRSKNYISVIPNCKYYLRLPNTYNFGSGFFLYFYDINKNFISSKDNYLASNQYIDIPSNCSYLRFRFNGSYGTTYNHDITISLYYSPEQGGEGYDQYYPYEAPYEVNTGSEVLRSAGSVRDSKLPSGEIIRRIGVVDLSTISWSYDSPSQRFLVSFPNVPISAQWSTNLICDKYSVGRVASDASTPDKMIGLYNGVLYLRDDALNGNASGITGTLYYELATPTTEQGTSFSENLPIDDYGMMYWDNTNGVPQGANIFYQVNYKGFVDDMYSIVSGDSSQYVIQSELTPYDNKDTQLQNAIGGTLRQCLCVKETLDFDNTDFVDLGTLTYSYVSSYSANVFTASVSGMKVNTTKIICTKYKNGDMTILYYSMVNLTISTNNNQFDTGARIFIKDTSFNGDATAFKNAMKGVLLAYEKA